MNNFPKFSDRIDLENGWISFYKFTPMDGTRANVEFVFINGRKKRREKRIAKKVFIGVDNLWNIQYNNKYIFFQMI